MSRRESDTFDIPDEPHPEVLLSESKAAPKASKAKGRKPKEDGDSAKLREMFYGKMKGMGKFDKLWYRLQKEYGKKDNPFSQKQVKAWLAKQRGVQETRKFKKRPGLFTSIRGKRPGNIFQIDLMFFKFPLGKQKWSGVLNAVDVYSRRAWSEFIKADPKPMNHKKGTPWRMKTKGGKGQQSVLAAFKRILEQSTIKGKPVVPKHVNMDQGNEFTNKLFRSFLAEKGITPHFSRAETFAHNPIVERFNRTLRDKMAEYDGDVTQETWSDLIDGYNSDFHRTIQGEPMEVWEGKEKNKQELKDPTFDFKEGDDVRLLIRKGAFEKGTWEYSKDVFRIYDVQRSDKKSTSRVARYFVMDSDGDPLTSMDSESGKEEPSFYMGYQLLLANDIEDSPNYKEQKVKQQAAQTEKKEKAAKVSRKLAKEGLDDAAPVTRTRRKKRDKELTGKDLVGKRIQVGFAFDKPMTSAVAGLKSSLKNLKPAFYWGTITKFSSSTGKHSIKFEEDNKTLRINVSNPKDDDYISDKYIKPANWKKA